MFRWRTTYWAGHCQRDGVRLFRVRLKDALPPRNEPRAAATSARPPPPSSSTEGKSLMHLVVSLCAAWRGDRARRRFRCGRCRGTARTPPPPAASTAPTPAALCVTSHGRDGQLHQNGTSHKEGARTCSLARPRRSRSPRRRRAAAGSAAAGLPVRSAERL